MRRKTQKCDDVDGRSFSVGSDQRIMNSEQEAVSSHCWLLALKLRRVREGSQNRLRQRYGDKEIFGIKVGFARFVDNSKKVSRRGILVVEHRINFPPLKRNLIAVILNADRKEL